MIEYAKQAKKVLKMMMKFKAPLLCGLTERDHASENELALCSWQALPMELKL
jgi:hypothetical protein